MFKPQYGTCSQCHKDDQLIAVKSGCCQKCNYDNKQKKKGLSHPSKPLRKPTGEKDVFEVVLDNNEPVCFVCGEPISLIMIHNFAHILRKGNYPKFRLNPDNIRIMCYKIDGSGCHSLFDFNPRSTLKGSEWEKVFELEEKLKQQYNNL